MTVNLESYRQMLAQPWGKIQYDITFSQLSAIENQTVLDFGAGLGLVSSYLAEKNQVTAIEPNEEMLEPQKVTNYEKLLGSLDQLEKLADDSFDLLLCHNVLEYIPLEERLTYLNHFKRLVKPNGRLSIIKHNQVGKVMQTVVFANDVDKALKLLEGEAFESVSFSQGETYTIEDLLELTQLPMEGYQAIRTFYSLQPNDVKLEEGWLEQMTEMELAVCDLKPYKDISFLQHIWLINQK
ncbi:class I SAM-dependent methyltransferase [Streptococcus saliviloxodontae]|uniref:2-polyprenyl-3-methyl-5-hydroxy-6-metoxy-1, 4-benzoquinol methylase n=1 Tax=Streptococcus saliviloxodontae TaxID=1349416 RepID=A0ABS2PK97_9STRE|nr:class I SAM-dependent methyltransferase [Streptococcus saliviloxodontae]MBM7635855.1 2-polyprenyl-3-methyl-5-hydroxy-6-metoxy-1,4-benzoquinol methylase [Streptococcus saliviloxodontae]